MNDRLLKQERIPDPSLFVPGRVLEAMDMLTDAGYEAYLVGGCVRDLLTGRTPYDYDITTSALPEETENVFAGYKVVETGLKHGTVTVIYGGFPLEITTYRTDGTYSDGRHPDSVSFTRSLKEDLARRDFTVNAIAWSKKDGWKDPFGGMEDLKNRVLKCVGRPEDRFSEDALRILRFVRFLSQLGFSADPETESAANALRDKLRLVSVERVYAELTKMLCGPEAEKVLLRYHGILGVVIPDLTPCVGFPQITKYHIHDVYTHTCAVVAGVRPDPVLRWAALLHDIAKPVCHEFYDGKSHFHEHPEKGAFMARGILTGLHAEKRTIDTVSLLVRKHDTVLPPERKPVIRLLTEMTAEEAVMLTELMEADCMGKSETGKEAIPRIRQMREAIERVANEQPALHVTDLHIRGKDLQEIGFVPGQDMGDCLRKLLEDVQDETLENTEEALKKRAAELLKKS